MASIEHFEVFANDVDRAIAFYESALGWSFGRWGEVEYWLITTGSEEEPSINGALLPREGEIDGEAVIAYVCTVGVENLDETLEKALESGGTLAVPKRAVSGIGWHAYINPRTSLGLNS